jgi:Secretion system C-terminal sorting domain/Metallo-peptidase family M12B Reprolysin-like
MKSITSTLLMGESKSIALSKKSSVFLLFLLLNSFILKAQDFIQEVPESKAKFSDKSKTKIDKLKKNENILSVKFIEFGDLKKSQNDGKVRFKLPGIDEDLDLITIRVEYKSDTEYNWYATTKDGIGSVIILRKGDNYTGHFSLPDKKEFQIMSEEGQHILIRMKPRRDGRAYCGAKLTQKEKNNTEKPTQISAERIEPCWDPIRILVLWTQNAANTGLNISDIVNTSVGQFNSSIYRSNITSEAALSLVGFQKIDFTETNNIDTDWTNLAASGNNGTIRSLRDLANADIVVLLTNANYGGYTGTVGNFSMNQNSAFAIVKIGNAVDDTKTFAREVGHLFGARHEISADPGGPSYAHAHTIDFAWPTANCYTVMISSETDNVVENFSNPNVYLSGLATGTITSNNAQRVSETWQTVRNHRPNVNFLSSGIDGSSYCNLFQTYTWEAVARCAQGTVSYEWFTSYDGFNWTFRSNNEFYSELFYWGANSYRFLRLRVSSGGQVSESNLTIYLQGGGQGYRIATLDNQNSETTIAPIVWKNPKFDDDESEKVNLVIEQIYPNPSQATFALNFNTPIEQDISLDLIDASGHAVNLFAKEHYQKGKYSKKLDVGNLSSGTYIVKLSSDIESATTKLVILK